MTDKGRGEVQGENAAGRGEGGSRWKIHQAGAMRIPHWYGHFLADLQ